MRNLPAGRQVSNEEVHRNMRYSNPSLKQNEKNNDQISRYRRQSCLRF